MTWQRECRCNHAKAQFYQNKYRITQWRHQLFEIFFGFMPGDRQTFTEFVSYCTGLFNETSPRR